MAKILLWNSLATRRRSASDTFFDNGLGVLKAHLEGEGHNVHLEDWATDLFHSGLAVSAVARPLRTLYHQLLSRRGEGPPPTWVKVLGAGTAPVFLRPSRKWEFRRIFRMSTSSCFGLRVMRALMAPRHLRERRSLTSSRAIIGRSERSPGRSMPTV